MKANSVPASLILGFAFVLGMLLLGNKILETKRIGQYVSVKGLAEKDVTADQGSWLISAANNGNDLNFIKNDINDQVEIIQAWLVKKGFAKEEIKVEELSLQENIYGQTQARYTARLQITVSTDKVELLDEVSGQANELIDEGITLSGDRWMTRPRYYFTKINEVKPELLADATRAALKSAEEFATNSGATVGGIRRASQGIISLIPANRVNESEEFYLKKIARVVSSIDYYIE